MHVSSSFLKVAARHLFLMLIALFFSTQALAQTVITPISPAPNQIYYTNSMVLDFSFSSSSALSNITINGSPAYLMSNGQYSTFNLNTTSGPYFVDINGIDSNNQAVSLQYSFQLIIDMMSPTIQTPTFPLPSSSYNFSFDVIETNPVKINVFQNSILIYQSSSNHNDVITNLGGGSNTFLITATDAAGNISTYSSPVLVYDNIQPVLSNVLPTVGSIIQSTQIPVSATSNERLNSVLINNLNANISSDGLSFWTTVEVNTSGPGIVHIVASDISGNMTTVDIPYERVDQPGGPVIFINPNNLHTCTAVNGAAYCWGWNGYGQLGDGTFTNRNTPNLVPGVDQNITLVRAGNYHSCAVLSNGSAKCWGRNDFGEVGNRVMGGFALSAVNVIFDQPTLVRDIALGSSFTCALVESNVHYGVMCWGGNFSGQLGNGTFLNSGVPQFVSGLTQGVLQITALGSHVCAILNDHSLKCWGDGSGGKLGVGTTSNSALPVSVPLANVNKISAGSSHTCAITLSGTSYCWGIGSDGQLGNGTTSSSLSPTQVLNLNGIPTDIVTGISHTCALMGDTSVKCWGSNSDGELGLGVFSTRNVNPTTVVNLGPGSGVVQIGAGLHTCATLATQFMCWGRNDQGQIGDGTTQNRSIPVSVLNLNGFNSTGTPVVIADFIFQQARSLPPALVNFDASSSTTSSGTISSYAWDFGDGAISSGINASHTYSNSGNFLVKLTVTSSANVSVVRSKYVIIQQFVTPTAGFTVLPQSQYNYIFNGSISFSPNGQIVSYDWNFGDGTIASGIEVSHVFSIGSKTIQLKVKDEFGQTAITYIKILVADHMAPALTITQPLEGAVITGNTFNISGLASEQLLKLSVNGISINLNADLRSFIQSFSSLANGNIALNFEAIDLAGNILRKSINVTFSKPPAFPILVNLGGPYFAGPNNPIDFNASNTIDPNGGTLSYIWDFGDGSFGYGADVIHSYSTLGTYAAKLSVISTSAQTAQGQTNVVIGTPTVLADQVINIISTIQVEGGLTAVDANLLISDINSIKLILNGGFGGSSSGGSSSGGSSSGGSSSGGSSSGGGPNFSSCCGSGIDQNLIDAIRKFINDLSQLIRDIKIQPRDVLRIIRGIISLTRAIAGDPIAIIEVAQLVVTELHVAGVISDNDFSSLIEPLNVALGYMQINDPIKALETFKFFNIAVAQLAENGIIPSEIAQFFAQQTIILNGLFGKQSIYGLVFTLKEKLSQLENLKKLTHGTYTSILNKITTAIKYYQLGNTPKVKDALIQIIDEVSKNQTLTQDEKNVIIGVVNAIIALL